MKTHSSSIRRGFTLVEMLAVITIIVILSAAVIAGTKYAQEKMARDKAKVQVQMLAAALDEYNAATGSFPPGGNGGKGDSNIIYKALYWDSNNDGAGPDTDRDQKIYISELDPENNHQGWTDGKKSEARIIDPWGHEYHYRSGKDANGKANPTAVNPDFDLWSDGPDGKTTISGDSKDTKDDIRNW